MTVIEKQAENKRVHPLIQKAKEYLQTFPREQQRNVLSILEAFAIAYYQLLTTPRAATTTLPESRTTEVYKPSRTVSSFSSIPFEQDDLEPQSNELPSSIMKLSDNELKLFIQSLQTQEENLLGGDLPMSFDLERLMPDQSS